MNKDVNLISYLPSVIAGFKEINAAMAAENKEFVLAWKSVDQVLQNEFITSADEYGIAGFEKILHILPLVDESLEVRRARVQAEWFTALPYTWRMFAQKIRETCGEDHPVTIICAGSYMIHVKAGIESQWQIESLIDVAEKMLPCNMGIAVKNSLPLDLETPAPTIKPDWFGYGVEYTGETITGESGLIIHMVCMHVLMPFWGGAAYNGQKRYNGTLRYNAKRSCGLRMRIKTVLQLYTEQAAGYAGMVFGGHIQYKSDAGLSVVFYYYSRLKERVQAAAGIYMGLQSPRGGAGNMSIKTERNAVRYNGTRRYNGAMKYNALYKKEQIE